MAYEAELAFAKELALEAGAIMRQYFLSDEIGTEWKPDDTPLTIADTTINALVIERVKSAFPSHGIIGEEESYDVKGDFVWVVDPIDGTMPFSLGIPVSMFSLALVDRTNGQSVVAVAYDPHLSHLYSAVKDEGATLNDKPIMVNKQTELKNAYVGILGSVLSPDKGYPYRSGYCADLARQLGAKPMNMQSYVYIGCKVASGEFSGSIFGYGSPWDSAAVALIVKEAGGVVTDMNGQSRRYDDWAGGGILAATPELHVKLSALLQQSL